VHDESDPLSTPTSICIRLCDISTHVLRELGNLDLLGRGLLTRSGDVPGGSTLGSVGIINLAARIKIGG
jgi:hypothetical protein